MSKLSNEVIKKLEEMGGTHFKKGTVDRIYFGAKWLGLHLVYEHNHNGNMREAWLHYKQISICQGARLDRLKHWIDVETGECHTTRRRSKVEESDGLQEELKNLLNKAKEIVEEEKMDKQCDVKTQNTAETIGHRKMIDEIVNRAIADTLKDDGLAEAKMKYGYLERCHMQVITNRQLENMFREILHQKEDNQMLNNKIDELNTSVEELKNLFVEQKQRSKKRFDIRKLVPKLTKKAVHE